MEGQHQILARAGLHCWHVVIQFPLAEHILADCSVCTFTQMALRDTQTGAKQRKSVPMKVQPLSGCNNTTQHLQKENIVYDIQAEGR